MTQLFRTALAGVAFAVLTSPANAAGAEPVSHTFNISVTIDQNSFSSAYRFAGPGGAPLATGQLHYGKDQRLSTHTPILFTLWETSPDGSTEQQVTEYQMQLTDVEALWWGHASDELIPVGLIKAAVDGQSVNFDTDIEINSGTSGSNALSVGSEQPLPDRTSGNSNIRVSLVAMFVNKI